MSMNIYLMINKIKEEIGNHSNLFITKNTAWTATNNQNIFTLYLRTTELLLP
jgi:hypothetical protein